ncbi:MAG TPA: ankyrin repeat domain-containing protein [Candidatus Babeliales bacterium]|nr:ankyrin repeat domain-containing protein [Candidatus Babeliales bacterium]
MVKNNFTKILMVGVLLCGAMPLFAMERVKKIVRQVQGGPEYANDIFSAIKQGSADSVKYWLDQGVDIETKDPSGKTLLMIAVEQGKQDIARLLLDRKAYIEARDVDGKTALMLAVKKNDREMVILLLDKGADIDVVDKDGDALLAVALKQYQTELAKLLIDKGVNIDEVDKYGKTLLVNAIERGDTLGATLLLDRGADTNSISQYGTTPLILALESNRLEVAKLFIDKGADIDAVDRYGLTALLIAIKMHQVEIVTLLIDKGANTEAVDTYGSTALIVAVEKGQVKVATLLIDKGANIDAVDKNGSTALIVALNRGQVEIATLLIDKGANINAVDKNGSTALIIALQDGLVEVATLLIDKGANSNAVDKNGRSALMIAINRNQFEMIPLLLNKGANIDYNAVQSLLMYGLKDDYIVTLLQSLANSKNADGEPIVAQAIIHNDSELAERLIKNGANPYLRDKAGLNAFDYAHAQDNPAMLAILRQTQIKAPTNEPVAEHEVKSTDTQKAIRRLARLSGHMAPEQQQEAVTSGNELPIGSAQEQLTPTEVHYSGYGKNIESKYGEGSKYGRKGRALLDDPIVKECIEKERVAYQQGEYVFYRSEPGKYRVYEFFLEELYRLVRLLSNNDRLKPFIMTRFFKYAAKEQTINEYIDTKPWKAHKLGKTLNVLLSANIPLFGNVHNSGSCTWDYFLNNYEATGKVDVQDMFQDIFNIYGFDNKYIKQLLALQKGKIEEASSLQQIIIPKKSVDDVVMFATHGYCFPWPEMVDPSCWDPKAVSVDPKGNEKLGRHTCVSSIIDKYRNGDIEIDDNMQVRILMNAVYGLNPASGIEFNLYTRLPKKRIEYFKKQVAEITDAMFSDWLKTQLKSKEVSAGVEGEPLGDVLQRLGKGRKEQEKVKAKL